MSSPTRLIVGLALAAGVMAAGWTYMTADPRPLRDQATSAAAAGSWKKAERLMLGQVRVAGARADDWYVLGNFQSKLGAPDRAKESWKAAARLQGDTLSNQQRGRRGDLYNLACYHALAGDKTAALDALERCVKAGYWDAPHMSGDDDLISLRDDPRFLEAVETARKNWEARNAREQSTDRPPRDSRRGS